MKISIEKQNSKEAFSDSKTATGRIKLHCLRIYRFFGTLSRQQKKECVYLSLASAIFFLILRVEAKINCKKAIALRHDVDACLWSSNSSDERVPLGHVATFDAVGYIHAGKQNLAFINAPPNNGYVCICEQKRRILLYKYVLEMAIDSKSCF